MVLVQTLVARLTLDNTQYRSGMRQAETRGRTFRTSLRGITSEINGLSRAMGLGGIGAAGLFAKSLKTTYEFRQNMANINSIIRVSQDELDDLSMRIRNVAKDSTSTARQMSNAYYDIVSGIQDTSRHMGILTAAEKTATGSVSDLTATTSLFVSVLNAYGDELRDETVVSDIFTNTIARGKLRMDELAVTLPRVTGLTGAMGVSFEDTSASMAYLSLTMESAAVAGTSLRSLVTEFIKPSTEMAKAINDLGYETGEAFLSENGFAGALNKLREAGVEMTDVIGRVEALSAAQRLQTEDAIKARDEFFKTSQGMTENAIAARGNEDAIKELRSSLEDLEITIGNSLAPTLNTFIKKHLDPAVQSVGDWLQQNPEFLQSFLDLAPKVVGLLIGLKGVSLAVQGINLAVSGFTLLKGSFIAAATAMGVALGPLIAGVVAFVTATVAAIDLVQSLNRQSAKNMNQATKLALEYESSIRGGYITSVKDMEDRLYQRFRAERPDAIKGDLLSEAAGLAPGVFDMVQNSTAAELKKLDKRAEDDLSGYGNTILENLRKTLDDLTGGDLIKGGYVGGQFMTDPELIKYNNLQKFSGFETLDEIKRQVQLRNEQALIQQSLESDAASSSGGTGGSSARRPIISGDGGGARQPTEREKELENIRIDAKWAGRATNPLDRARKFEELAKRCERIGETELARDYRYSAEQAMLAYQREQARREEDRQRELQAKARERQQQESVQQRQATARARQERTRSAIESSYSPAPSSVIASPVSGYQPSGVVGGGGAVSGGIMPISQMDNSVTNIFNVTIYAQDVRGARAAIAGRDFEREFMQLVRSAG